MKSYKDHNETGKKNNWSTELCKAKEEMKSQLATERKIIDGLLMQEMAASSSDVGIVWTYDMILPT